MKKENIENYLYKQPVVESFCIEGLFGDRNILLDMKNSASVLIAQNGAGKTTTMGAMDAFLKRQFLRFATLDFSRIVCKLRDCKDEFILERTDVDNLVKISSSRKFEAFQSQFEIPPLELLSLFVENYYYIKNGDRSNLPVDLVRKISIRSRVSQGGFKDYLTRISNFLDELNSNTFQLSERLSQAIGSYEILYLPTYRRIELALPKVEDITNRIPSLQEKLGLNKNNLHSGDIQFGLRDISARLSELNDQMLFQSNQGYREISANIVNDLLSGIFDNDDFDKSMMPSKESLALFFDRIKDGRRYVGPYNEVQIPDLNKIYNDDVPEQSRKFLNYFLGKLNMVMLKTKNIEGMVEEFINSSNEYLSSKDWSTNLFGNGEGLEKIDNDGKVLSLDRRRFTVSVNSIASGRGIPLDSLSSGEKQMISLFAKMYLYPSKKIVLIDEPELSLSIDWQQRILVDIFRSETCTQLIAITHSPFIFENEMEPLAAPLMIEIHKPDSQSDMGVEEDQEDI